MLIVESGRREASAERSSLTEGDRWWILTDKTDTERARDRQDRDPRKGFKALDLVRATCPSVLG